MKIAESNVVRLKYVMSLLDEVDKIVEPMLDHYNDISEQHGVETKEGKFYLELAVLLDTHSRHIRDAFCDLDDVVREQQGHTPDRIKLIVEG